MALPKPYYRIIRPGVSIEKYVLDTRYSNDRAQLKRAYLNLERQLIHIFDYIEPDDRNLKVFSFELYSLLLRACTEVELNCKLILEANDAVPIRRYFTMEDYIKIEKSSKLSKYKIVLPNWKKLDKNTGKLQYCEKILRPFSGFKKAAPVWYQDYNSVKHNREDNLHKASLKNVINAVSGILVLLYSQFGPFCLGEYKGSIVYGLSKEYDCGPPMDTMFTVIAPTEKDWANKDHYDFDWNTLKKSQDCFEKYKF